MAVNRELIVDFISELYDSVSLEGHFQVYERFVRELGYDGATYTFAPRIQFEAMQELPAIFLSTESYPTGFIEQYTKERLDQHDFTARKLFAGELSPLDWREHELSGQLSPEEVGVIQLARNEYGITNAISVPVMSEEKGIAGASIISYLEDESFTTLKSETLDTLVSITRFFHGRIFNEKDLTQKFILPVLQSLTPTQIAILTYKASGRPMKNIEEHTSISSSYASNVLSHLKSRLGGVNTDRMMYLLGLLNTLSDITPDEEDE